MSYCAINSWMGASVIKEWNFWSKGGANEMQMLGKHLW